MIKFGHLKPSSVASEIHELATSRRRAASGDGERDCCHRHAPSGSGGDTGRHHRAGAGNPDTARRGCAPICLSASVRRYLQFFPMRLRSRRLGDHTRIAAQIIPGIGFIGAGSILHTRGLTTGLTTASTLFVVASVGMATGGGLYLTAIFATGVVLIALFSLGHLELTFNLKTLLISYEVTGRSVDEITLEVNRILEPRHRMMQNVENGSTSQHVRLQFDVIGCNREQQALLRDLKASSVLGTVTSLGPVELE